MNIASLIASFATSATYSVTRTARGQTVRGRIGLGTQTTVSIIGSVSPASGKDIDRLPEGHTDKETRVIFTATELYAGGQGQDYEADKVIIDGDDWEVTHVETWVDSRSRATGYRVIVIRE